MVGRLSLLVFFAFVIPAGAFWASHGFRPLHETTRHFREQVRALGGERPKSPEEPKPVVGQVAGPETAPGPETPPEPPPVAPPRTPTFEELFLQGKFAAAASAPADEKSRSVARLGNALAAAFPVSLPPGRYLRVIARGGVAFEGFAEETPEGIRLMQATGASLTLPTDTVTSKQEVPKETAIATLVEKIAKQGKDPGAKVPGLFLLMEQALRLGRPDAAAPILLRVVAMDVESALFPNSVRTRVPADRQPEVQRAYIACMGAHAPQEVVAAPRPTLGREEPLRPAKPSGALVKDPRALALLDQAAPIRLEGERLYRKVNDAGLKEANGSDISEAIRLLEQAIDLYGQAMEIEDSNGVQALITACSKKSRNLRFWQLQVESR